MSNNIESVQRYKEMDKRVTLMQDADWVKAIGQLKEMKFEEGKIYSAIYRQYQQRKKRSFTFHNVQFVEETDSFILTSYVSDWETGELTNEVDNKLTLKDIEIIKLDIEDEFDYSDFI